MKRSTRPPSLRQIAKTLGCEERQRNGICWLECNTSADKVAIVVHGVTGGKIDMMPLAEQYVRAGYAVYAVDLPGHGGSELPELRSYDDLAAWLARAVDAIGRTPDLLSSNSYGSSVVYRYMVNGLLPQKTRVVLACPTPHTSHVSNVLQIVSTHMPKKAFWAVYNIYLGQLIRGVVGMNTYDRGMWLWFLESEKYKKATTTLQTSTILSTLLYNDNPFTASPSLEVQRRVTVVMGARDRVVSEKARNAMRQLLPEAKIRIVPNAGHILHFEAWRDLLPDEPGARNMIY